MPTNGEDRLARLELLVQQDAENIHELAVIARAHQGHIEALYNDTSELKKGIAELKDTVSQVVVEWQAYLRRQPKQ